MRDIVYESWKIINDELKETSSLLADVTNLLQQTLYFTPEHINFFASQQIIQAFNEYNSKMDDMFLRHKELINESTKEQ